MTYTPIVKEMNIQQQGGVNFPYVAGWIDTIISTSSHAEYDVDAARTAMGLPAGMPLFALFSYDGGVWVNFNATAVIPTGASTDGSGSEYSPNQRYLDKSVSKISFVSAASQKVSIQFFRP